MLIKREVNYDVNTSAEEKSGQGWRVCFKANNDSNLKIVPQVCMKVIVLRTI